MTRDVRVELYSGALGTRDIRPRVLISFQYVNNQTTLSRSSSVHILPMARLEVVLLHRDKFHTA